MLHCNVQFPLLQCIAGSDDALRAALIEADADGIGFLALPQLEAALCAAGVQLVQQQVVIIFRHLARDAEGRGSVQDLLHKVLERG